MPTQISLNFIVIIDGWTPCRRYIQTETLLRLVLQARELLSTNEQKLQCFHFLAVKRSVSRPLRNIRIMRNSSLYNGGSVPYFALALGHLAVRS